MSILILAEHNGQQLNPSVRQAVTAAQIWNLPVHLLIAGHDADVVAQSAASIEGIAQVIYANAAHYAHATGEDIAQLIESISADYKVIMAAHSAFSRNSLPRVAARLDVAMISDVLEIKPNNTYVRSIYAGNILTTVQSTDAKQVLTIHASQFSEAALTGSVLILPIQAAAVFNNTRWLFELKAESNRPALSSANIVVSGGRSLGSAEKFEQILSPLANKLGAALGATRAAVDAAFAPNDIQVGQTGVVVAPQLYIAVGVSGAVQHTYGMKDSKIVVAINEDPDAPIFQVADYGLVADLFEAVPALTAAI